MEKKVTNKMQPFVLFFAIGLFGTLVGCNQSDAPGGGVSLVVDARFPPCENQGTRHFILENHLRERIAIFPLEKGQLCHDLLVDWNGKRRQIEMVSDEGLPPIMVSPGERFQFSVPFPGSPGCEYLFDPPFDWRLVVPYSVLRKGVELPAAATSAVEHVSMDCLGLNDLELLKLFPGLRPSLDVVLFDLPDSGECGEKIVRRAVGFSNRTGAPIPLSSSELAFEVQEFRKSDGDWLPVCHPTVNLGSPDCVPSGGSLLVPIALPDEYFREGTRLVIRFPDIFPRPRRIESRIYLSQGRQALDFGFTPIGDSVGDEK